MRQPGCNGCSRTQLHPRPNRSSPGIFDCPNTYALPTQMPKRTIGLASNRGILEAAFLASNTHLLAAGSARGVDRHPVKNGSFDECAPRAEQGPVTQQRF